MLENHYTNLNESWSYSGTASKLPDRHDESDSLGEHGMYGVGQQHIQMLLAGSWNLQHPSQITENMQQFAEDFGRASASALSEGTANSPGQRLNSSDDLLQKFALQN